MSRSAVNTTRSAPTLPPGSPRARVTVLADTAGPPRMTDEPVLLIGGRRDCHIPLVHGDVSQVHAAIVNTGTTLIIADLSSRTGTYVNDERITVRPLAMGDRVRIANINIKLEWLFQSTPPNPAAAHLKSPLRLVLKNGTRSLTTLPAVIGRRQTCALVLDTPDVSLAHALLFAVDNRPALLDLGSRSGTFLNGQRMQCAWLQDTDRLFIGGESFTAHWAGPVGGKDAPAQAAANVATATTTPASGVSSSPPLALAAPPAPMAPTLAAPISAATISAATPAVSATVATTPPAPPAATPEFSLAALELAAIAPAAANATATTASGAPATPSTSATAALATAAGTLASEQLVAELESQLGKLRATMLTERQLGAEQALSLASREALVATREEAVVTRESAVAARAGEHAAERDALDKLAAQLQERARALNEREAALTTRERDFADQLQQIESFRAALNETSQKFGMAGPRSMTPRAEDTPMLRVDRPMFGGTAPAGFAAAVTPN